MGRPAGSSRPRPSARETFEEAFKSRGTCGWGQENNRGFLRGVLEEAMGHKNFTISELGDRPDHLLVKCSLLLI